MNTSARKLLRKLTQQLTEVSISFHKEVLEVRSLVLFIGTLIVSWLVVVLFVLLWEWCDIAALIFLAVCLAITVTVIGRLISDLTKLEQAFQQIKAALDKQHEQE